MPALAAIPWLVPLLAGVSAATTIGTSAYELSQGGGGGGSASTTAQDKILQQQQQAAQAAQQKAAFAASQGNAQAQTGGSLTPTGFAEATALQAGLPSDLNSLLRYLGPGGGGGTGANVSGGVGQSTTTTPGAGSNDLEGLATLLKAA